MLHFRCTIYAIKQFRKTKKFVSSLTRFNCLNKMAINY